MMDFQCMGKKSIYFRVLKQFALMKTLHKLILLFFLAILPSITYATVKLPRIFSDHMVLQRQREIRIWGWAASGENVRVSFNGEKAETKASGMGLWVVRLRAMEHGGPYEMEVSGKTNSIILKNILIGDVWLGSGQSNMEWVLANTNDAQKEIAAANYPKIRMFTVEKDQSFKPLQDLKSGEWKECTPANAGNFSAVAYFFGRTLNKELDIPMGLINSSWGGTKVEPWISWDLISQEAEYKNMKLNELEKQSQQSEKNVVKFLAAMKNDKGIAEKWFDPSADVSTWRKISVPSTFENSEIGNTDGIVWYRKEFNLSASDLKDATLSLGPVDDVDVTYINGTEIGSMNTWNEARIYPVKKELLREGKNVLVIKVTDNSGGGGIYGKPEVVFFQSGENKITLAGDWLYKTSVVSKEFNVLEFGPNAYPSHLFNAMIAPITPYAIRGVIWYQGESNTSAAYRYSELFPMLIKNWRSKWGYDFPFLWVQLANFMKPSAEPSESNWAELREAQRMALALPKTGQAVIIDIGEADDIHPRNKKDVGHRLALSALAVEYGKSLVHSGPVYKSMEVRDGKAVLTFEHTGTGLMAKADKYGYLRGFTIAGEDKRFYWAKAVVEGNQVVVYSDQVKIPVAVRYAWADNPEDANFYNRDGLPASPFRTDSWDWITKK